ncbi:MAG: lysophospholipid acyltransferase family protein [Deltaproteobacteria bacterium]|nr:lysophospholipid acyltransferase family protein [Deltaproteobacteria bacterium]
MNLRVPETAEEARRSHVEAPVFRRALLWGLRNVPLSTQEASLPGWATLFYLQVPHVRRALEANLAHLTGLGFPWLQAAAFGAFVNYCRSVASAYRLHAGLESGVRVSVEGRHHLEAALAAGRGAILATGHLGHWQVGPYLLRDERLPPTTVVMAEEPHEGVQALEGELRDSRLRVVYPARTPFLGLALRAALAKGEFVALQMDRPSSAGGVEVACLGGVATFAAGPAQLARLCGAPVVPAYFPRVGDEVRVLIEPALWSRPGVAPEVAERELTARLAESYGRQVRAHPEQWYNFYRFWREPEGSEDAHARG